MNYKIIKNADILKSFITWLPDLLPHEKFYLCLFARSKYTKNENGENGLVHIKSDKAQLKRFVSDKERMFDKIKQLEIEVGYYKQKGVIVPESALALYITPNPRDMWKATTNTMVKLAQSIRDQNILQNPHQEALSEIQKSKGKTHYVDFDIDTKEQEVMWEVIYHVKEMFGVGGYEFLETRGGYHVLVKPDYARPEFKNKWYQTLEKFADQNGGGMIPVAGCTQGDFIPMFVNL